MNRRRRRVAGAARHNDMRHHAERGFSLVELLVVAGIVAVLAIVTLPISDMTVKWARADSGSEAALRAIAAARDRAIAERRNIELTFLTPNRLRLERQEVNSAGVTIGRTTLSETFLENGQVFVKFAGIPDTPDLFGNASALTFGGTAPYMFTSDGSFIDSAGDVINGTVLVGAPNQPDSQRAVTIFGVSGLTRLWKWRGGQWVK